MPTQTAPPNLTDAPALIDRILADAVARRASDVHLEPVPGGCEVRCRVDGLLQTSGTFDTATGRALVGRLMVLAHLLTYRLDIPQEGRLTVDVPREGGSRGGAPHGQGASDSPLTLDLRLAVMPTAHGLRAAVRLPAELVQPGTLEDLALPPHVAEGLRRFAGADQGMLIVTGPAGSGKTTTIYALLRHVAETSPGLSIITLEDPVERHLPGVTQIEVKPFGELTYERALRSILRQDPQVLMLGEIRDAATASLALQAALSGHRLVCTLHAGTPGGAVARLLEMGSEPYQVTSSLYGVVAQRLLRRRNPSGPGYLGRVPVAEFTPLEDEARQAVLRRSDAATLDRLFAQRPGHVTLRQSAAALVVKGVTNAEEVARVLGSGTPEDQGR